MRPSLILATIMASAILPGASSAALAAPADDTLKQIQQQIDALNKKGQYTVNPGSLAIESWLLTSTAIDSSAARIGTAVRSAPGRDGQRPVLVVSGTETLDFAQVEMLQLELDWLAGRLKQLSGRRTMSMALAPPAEMVGALVGLLKSDVQLDAISQEVDAKLLAAAVAGKIDNAFLPSAAISSGANTALIRSFKALMAAADEARAKASKEQQEELKLLLARYDGLAMRLLTPDKNGVAPLAFAARLQSLSEGNPYILRVNTEKAGGTLLKRTNVLTALGAESAFISGGLVSSYQLTDPTTGRVIGAGVITCRTTLTSLKRVQQASWMNSDRQVATASCLP